MWSSDISRAERIALQLEAGKTFGSIIISSRSHSLFGDHKESGVGVEFGLEGLHGMCKDRMIGNYNSFN